MSKFTTINILIGQPNSILYLKKGYDKTFKNMPTVSEDFPRIILKCMKFIQFLQLEIVIETTSGLQPNKHFKRLKLTFGGRGLVTRRFGLHSNSRDVDEIRHLTISIDFCARKLYYYSCYCYFFMEYYELPSPPLFIRDWGFWKIIEKRIKIFL